MTKTIDCPVCDRTGIEGETCPNCETNLSVFRLLAELPPPKSSSYPSWLPIAIGLICLLLGISFAAVGVYYIRNNQPPVVASTPSPPTTPTIATPSTTPENTQCSRGFYYRVREGDSLSLIALHFYGDVNNLQPILEANPQLIGRENLIEVGEVFLVPNNKEYFCGAF